MNLDRPGDFAQVDRAGGLAEVEASAAQWREAAELANDLSNGQGVRLVVAGMGGSGIAGDLVQALAPPSWPAPVVVHRGPHLPGQVGPDAEVAAVSYSGNTAETVSALAAAVERGCAALAISSGGRLAHLCEDQGVPFVRVPGGRQPRRSLGYLAVPLLRRYGLAGDLDAATDVQEQLADRLGRHVATAENPAKRLAHTLAGARTVCLYGTLGLGALAAYRLKCQLNEDANMPAFWATVPEANHNEVAGWQYDVPGAPAAAVLLRDDTDPWLAGRVDALGEVLADRFDVVEQVHAGMLDAQEASPLARAAALLLFVDFVGVYTALALDRDPTPIALIDRLKATT